MQTDRARLQEYYSAFAEWGRLESAAGRVELERALQLLDQYLPAAGRVLDIGGGPGRYAIELARRGHRVVLADPSLALLEQARERITGSEVAAQIEAIDEASAEDLGRYSAASFDAVVAFGPFYHLLSDDERTRAAREVCRVLKQGGLAFVAFLPRLTAIASLLERAARAPEQVTAETLRRAAETGVFRNASSVGFQEGYYPAAGELEGLLLRAGLEVLATISLRSIAYRLEHELQSLTDAMRVEAERLLASWSTLPEVVASSGHALIVARRTAPTGLGMWQAPDLSRRAAEIRIARGTEAALVSSVLAEAATWAAERGAPLWPLEQLGVDAIGPDVTAGLYVLAMVGAEVVGTARLTRDDPQCWPDAAQGVAAYVHRVAVCRSWAGQGVPGIILDWFAKQARELGCSYLRLDCDARRPKLRSLYEGLGFRFHSERSVGRYTVARYERAVRATGSA